MTSTYKDYQLMPSEHIKTAERMSEIAAEMVGVNSVERAQVYALLSVAHANIALAQMKGAMRL